MDGRIWKDLLDRLGCLDNGRFTSPETCREVFVGGPNNVGPCIVLQRGRKPPEGWSYTEDFIIYDDGRGHRVYHAWHHVEIVRTNEA